MCHFPIPAPIFYIRLDFVSRFYLEICGWVNVACEGHLSFWAKLKAIRDGQETVFQRVIRYISIRLCAGGAGHLYANKYFNAEMLHQFYPFSAISTIRLP